MVTVLTDTGVARYQNIHNFAFDERFLVIIELNGDLEENVWRRLHSSLKICTESGSEIIGNDKVQTSDLDAECSFGRWMLIKQTKRYLLHQKEIP